MIGGGTEKPAPTGRRNVVYVGVEHGIAVLPAKDIMHTPGHPAVVRP